MLTTRPTSERSGHPGGEGRGQVLRELTGLKCGFSNRDHNAHLLEGRKCHNLIGPPEPVESPATLNDGHSDIGSRLEHLGSRDRPEDAEIHRRRFECTSNEPSNRPCRALEDPPIT